MAKAPTLNFRDPARNFDRDIDAILNRVYGDGANRLAEVDKDAAIDQLLARREQGSLELKEALEKLRERREKSQTELRLQEQIQYLRGEIEALQALGQEIELLRRNLAEDEESLL